MSANPKARAAAKAKHEAHKAKVQERKEAHKAKVQERIEARKEYIQEKREALAEKGITPDPEKVAERKKVEDS